MAEMETTSPETLGETSQAGLRRMRQLSASPAHLLEPSRSISHPTNGTLIYPAPAPFVGHLIAPLHPPAPPRSLPTPVVFGPSHLISTSYDGTWITIYHTSPTGPGGTLVIYPSSILSPLTTSTNIVPFSTLSLPAAPLAITHLFPPRIFLADGSLAPALGPAPPPGYDSSKGPALMVLTSNSLLLIHPTSTIQGNASSMNVIKANLASRAHIAMGDITVGDNAGANAVRGWMGLVPKERGIWVASETDDLKVLRVDVGVDDRGRWYLQTTPLPPLPRLNVFDDSENVILSDIQGVVFTALDDETQKSTSPGGNNRETGAGMAVILQDHLSSGQSRTRIESVAFRRREMELAEGFGEISGHSDVIKAWDWVTTLDPAHSSSSPSGTNILSIATLPAVPPHTLSLALLSTRNGLVLRYLNLAASVSPAESETKDVNVWNALLGEEVILGDLPFDGTKILASQGLERSGSGLAILTQGEGVTLVPGPKLDVADPISDSGKAAKTIVGAIKQHVDWSDTVRALDSITGQPDLSVKLLTGVWDQLKGESEVDELFETLRLQIALFGSINKQKRDFAAEAIKLSEASQLIAAAASKKDGEVAFDLDCVWPLVGVAEWAYATIGYVMRDIVNERAKFDWYGADSPEVSPSLRTLYIVQPQLRLLLLRLLAQLFAFSTYVSKLNRPIVLHETKFLSTVGVRDARATVLAKDRMAGLQLKEGVDLTVWGRAVQGMHQNGVVDVKTFEEELTSVLLSLDPTILSSSLRPILESLPNPSALFLSHTPDSVIYDAITFTPIPPGAGVKCSRCNWRTASLGSTTAVDVGDGVGESPWIRWKKGMEGGCGCGGRWTRGV